MLTMLDSLWLSAHMCMCALSEDLLTTHSCALARAAMLRILSLCGLLKAVSRVLSRGFHTKVWLPDSGPYLRFANCLQTGVAKQPTCPSSTTTPSTCAHRKASAAQACRTTIILTLLILATTVCGAAALPFKRRPISVICHAYPCSQAAYYIQHSAEDLLAFIVVVLEMDAGVMFAGYAGQQLLAASLLDEVCGKVDCSFIVGMGDNFYPCVSALSVLDIAVFLFFASALLPCPAWCKRSVSGSFIVKCLTSSCKSTMTCEHQKSNCCAGRRCP